MRVYSITNNTNGKVYIGMTKHELNVRVSQHLKIANNIPCYEKRNQVSPIHRAIAKYGIQNFSIDELESYTSHEDMCEGERFYIDKFDSMNRKAGYNLCPGGEGVVHTEEISQKKREAMYKLSAEGKLPQSKLTSKQVLEIKELIIIGKMTNREIATKYKISYGHVSAIQKNKTHKRILKNTPVLEHGKDGWYQTGFKNRDGTKNVNSKFTDEDVKTIKNRYTNGDAINDIAKDYGVVRQTISRLINNKSYN